MLQLVISKTVGWPLIFEFIKFPALIMTLLLAAGCSSSQKPLAISAPVPGEKIVKLSADSFDDELLGYVGQTITLEGLFVQGNFTPMVCPPEVMSPHGAKGVAIYASPDNKQGQDIIKSLWKLSKLSRIRVTGELHEFEGNKPNKSRIEMDVWPFVTPESNTRIFWVDVIRDGTAD